MTKIEKAPQAELAAQGGIVEYLESIKPKLDEAATRHLHPDRLIRVFLGIAARNPKIYECSKSSIVNALSQCSSTGLEPGGILKHADLIPRWNKHTNSMELTFQPRYGGLAELARRSKEVERVSAAPVYQWELDRDLFHITHEPPAIRHDWVPDPPPLDDKDIVGGYAVAELINGQRVQLWMSTAQVEKRRKVSQQPDGTFWTKWYAEMVRKTLLRSLFAGGLVPMDTESSQAMAAYVQADPSLAYADQPKPLTRAMKRVQAWRVPADPEPENVVEATAEEVSAYDLAMKAARDMGATDDEIAEAWVSSGIPDVTWIEAHPEDFTTEHGDLLLAALERMKGA